MKNYRNIPVIGQQSNYQEIGISATREILGEFLAELRNGRREPLRNLSRRLGEDEDTVLKSVEITHSILLDEKLRGNSPILFT